VNLNEVRFSQGSIGYRFRNGITIDELTEGLLLAARMHE
jgi:hypothetical protein